MDYNSKIHLILFIFIFIQFVLYYNLLYSRQESYTPISNDALQTLASVYNSDTLTVKNIVVTGSVTAGTLSTSKDATIGGNAAIGGNTTIKGNADIGNWTIKGNAIGIPAIGDINMDKDGWVRFLKYGVIEKFNADSYAGNGFASKNLWCGGGTLSADTVNSTNLNASGYISSSGGIGARGNITGGAIISNHDIKYGHCLYPASRNSDYNKDYKNMVCNG